MINILADIPILIVISVFISAIIFCFIKYKKTQTELKKIIAFLEIFKVNDLNYRMREIDAWMSSNPYTSATWNEFKNTLVYSESVALINVQKDTQYKNVSSLVQNVQTTSNPQLYFNEESLVTSKFNYKLTQAMPTILTGLGPLFTFLNISIAFGKIDFTSQENTIKSVSSFMVSMKAAAMVSVVAVASSLVYIMVEKLLYNAMCKNPLLKIEQILGELFMTISSEKFLYEILRETKIKDNIEDNVLVSIPEQFRKSINTGLSTTVVPYLENIIFGLDQLNRQIKNLGEQTGKSDAVDDLF